MIVGKINQTGNFLTTDNTELPNQYSENLQLQVEFDNKYDGYSWLWFCGYRLDGINTVKVLFDVDTNLITLPADAFKREGILYVQVAAIKGSEKIMLQPVKFHVNQSLQQDKIINPGVTDLEILEALFKQIVANEYDATLQELITEAQQQQTKAEEQQILAEQQQTKASNLQTEAKQQQDEVNRLIDLEIEYQKNEELRIENEIERINAENKRQQDTKDAITNAETATTNADNAAEEARSAVRDFSDTIISFDEFEQLENIQNGEQLKVLFGKIQKYFDHLNPTGAVTSFAGDTAPNGYLLCQGQAVSRTTYVNLFNVISTKYGSGDGSTTFNVPDLRGRVPVGLNPVDEDFKTLGNTGGEKSHTLTVQEMPSHNHSATLTINSGGAHTHSASSNSAGAHTHSVSGTAASAGAHTHTREVFKATGDFSNSTSNLNVNGGTAVATTYGQAKANNSAGAHTHSVSGTAASNGAHSHTITVNSGGAHSHTGSVSIGNTGGGQAHNNMQPYIVLNYIIKY